MNPANENLKFDFFDVLPVPSEILLADPYDIQHNFSRRFTEEIFYKYLYVENEDIKKRKASLKTLILSQKFNNRIIFLHGFSGTGKTTFLRSFIKENTDLNHVSIDLSSTISIQEHENESFNMIGDSLIDYLSNQHFTYLEPFINFLVTKEASLFRFFSKNLFSSLLDFPKESSNLNKVFFHTICTLDIKDLFLLFLLYLLYFQKTKFNNKITVVYFDNLDIIELTYLNKYFSESFPTILQQFTILSQQTNLFESYNFNFVTQVKFVFCLRDETLAQSYFNTSSHLYDRIYPSETHVKITNDNDRNFYKEIILKRIDFTNSLYALNSVNNEDWKNTSRALVSDFLNDELFCELILPLFNFDYRKITLCLYGLFDDKFYSKFIYSNYFNKKYIIRNIILFGIMKHLSNCGFFNDILVPKFDTLDTSDNIFTYQTIWNVIINPDYAMDNSGGGSNRLIFSNSPSI